MERHHSDHLPEPAAGPLVAISAEDYRRFVRQWLDRPKGRVPFPRRLKARLTALHYILRAFRSGDVYSEEEVNVAILERSPFALDHVQIRRYLVDYGMLGRKSDGSEYRVARTYLALARWDPDIPDLHLL